LTLSWLSTGRKTFLKVEGSQGQLVVEDGNHRLEAIRRAGDDQAWAVVGFESEADRTAFVATSDDDVSS
jgi:hypothetical protein